LEVWFNIKNMSDANALFETAIRIAAVADCDDECRTAAGLMQQAAELGHGAAAGAYGNMLMNGFGGKFDPDQAFHYWSQAALEGADADSAFRLGMVCRDEKYSTRTWLQRSPGSSSQEISALISCFQI
tara:strand:+ start:69057 stop:69440 length:384 start_codon:yes stop_codon:yes gene_type:complete